MGHRPETEHPADRVADEGDRKALVGTLRIGNLQRRQRTTFEMKQGEIVIDVDPHDDGWARLERVRPRC